MTEAACLIIKGNEGATSGGAAKTVTYDFHRGKLGTVSPFSGTPSGLLKHSTTIF